MTTPQILSFAVIGAMMAAFIWGRVRYDLIAALGLLAAAVTGIGAWLASLPFLTALDADLHLPLLGDVHVSSVLVFDLGVYMLVIGATVLMLIALAHQSLRSHRSAASGRPTGPQRVIK